MSFPQLITKQHIEELVIATKNSSKGWNRICLHSSASSLHHSMVMCMLPGIESGLHCHASSKDIITYSHVINSISISVRNPSLNTTHTYFLNENQFILSLPDCYYRSVRNVSLEPAIYLEHRLGPYVKEEVLWL